MIAIKQIKTKERKRKKLTEARERKGFSRQAFATLAGVSAEHVKSLEYGRVNPSLPLMFSICSLLDSTPQELFGDVITK